MTCNQASDLCAHNKQPTAQMFSCECCANRTEDSTYDVEARKFRYQPTQDDKQRQRRFFTAHQGNRSHTTTTTPTRTHATA